MNNIQNEELIKIFQKLVVMVNDIPCTCGDEYISRGMSSHDCPRCNWIDIEIEEKAVEAIKIILK